MSMSEIFVLLKDVIHVGEELVFSIKRTGTDAFCVSMTPLPATVDEDEPQAIQKARAALSIPKYLEGSAAELDTTFANDVRGYGEPRLPLAVNFANALQEAAEDLHTYTTHSSRGKTNTAGAGKGTGRTTVRNPGAAATPGASTSPAAASGAASAATAPKADDTHQPMSLFGDDPAVAAAGAGA
jgi:hypothetical protein